MDTIVMNIRILLAELNDRKFVILPKLIEKQVCIVDKKDNIFSLVSFGQYTSIDTNTPFDATKYVLLITDKYKCIVNAKPYETKRYLVNKAWRDLGYFDEIFGPVKLSL